MCIRTDLKVLLASLLLVGPNIPIIIDMKTKKCPRHAGLLHSKALKGVKYKYLRGMEALMLWSTQDRMTEVQPNLLRIPMGKESRRVNPMESNS